MKAITHTLAGSGLALFGLMAGAQEIPSKQIALDIKPQPMVDALNGWAQQTGFQIIVPDACAANKLDAPRVKGRLTAQAALGKLLKGTPLTYEFVNERTVAIQEQFPASLPAPTPTAGKQFDKRFVRVAAAQVEEAGGSSGGGAAESESREIAAANAREAENNKRQRRGVLEEVIVTAQRREERTIDVPMSITAISGEKLAEAGIANMLDLSGAVPSLGVSESGPGRQIISIRGLGGIRGSSSLIGVYLDEMPVSGAQNGFVAAYSDLRAIDLERVEVLKGPQGTLFGEGSAGGVVRFITNDPDLGRLGGDISTEFSNTADGDWSEKVVGTANVPIAEDVFGIRVAAVYETRLDGSISLQSAVTTSTMARWCMSAEKHCTRRPRSFNSRG